MPFHVFDHYEAPKTPSGAAAGAAKLGGNKGLIVWAQRGNQARRQATRGKESSAPGVAFLCWLSLARQRKSAGRAAAQRNGIKRSFLGGKSAHRPWRFLYL